MTFHVLKVGGLGLGWPHYEVYCSQTRQVWSGKMIDLPEAAQVAVQAAETAREPSEYEGIPGERLFEMEIAGDRPRGKRVKVVINEDKVRVQVAVRPPELKEKEDE